MAKAKYVQEFPEVDPPAAARGQVASFGGAPVELPQQMIEQTAASQGAAPSITPPTETQLRAADESAVAAWFNGKKIAALWSNEANRNAYISVPDLGWKKLSNANDSSLLSLTMLAAHAEQTNANVNIRIENDGMVHEIYVW